MQGKPKQLFSTILSYVTELVEIEKIPQIYNDTYKINIDKNEISSKVQYYMPNAGKIVKDIAPGSLQFKTRWEYV